MSTRLTFGDVFSVCSAMTPVQRRNVCRLVLSLTTGPADTDEAETWQAVTIWAADLLLRVRICTSEQLLMLLPEIREPIVRFGATLDDFREQRAAGQSDIQLQATHLGFCDRRHVTFTGWQKLLDLQTGELVDKLPVKPLETVGYDLAALYVRRVAECDARREAGNAADNKDDATKQETAASVG